MIELSLRFESDWHVGTGSGEPGGVDRQVVKDAHGMPFVPAKSLTGLIRDACEEVAAALDRDSDEVAAAPDRDSEDAPTWADWSRFLFGGANPEDPRRPPRAAAVQISPAHPSPALAAAVGANPLLGGTVTTMRPATALDEHRTARSATLRVVEVARRGSVLHASVSVTAGGPLPADAAFLLVTGISRVRAIGGHRRRGLGRVTVGQHPDDLARLLSDVLQRGGRPREFPPQAPANTESAVSLQQTAPVSDTWWSVPLTITAQQPLAVTSARKGNATDTLAFVPGTMVLAAALPRLGLDLRSELATGAFRAGDATPAIGGEASVAVPRVLARTKEGGDDRPYRNRLLATDLDRTQEKVERDRWVLIDEEAIVDQPVDLVLNHHAVIDDQTQRPTEQSGGLFARAGVAAGTVLHAELLFTDAVMDRLGGPDGPWIERLGEGPWRIGASKKDDYGRASVVVGHPHRCEPEVKHPTARIVVHLLSDVLLRDQRLRPTADPAALAWAVARSLGTTVNVAIPAGEETVAASAPRRRESWQASWGLPRPSLVGLAAGSVIVLEAAESIDGDALAALELTGIGERRAEGFGRLSINPPWASQPSLTPFVDVAAEPESAQTPPAATLEDDDAALLATIERAHHERSIEDAAAAAAAKPPGKGRPPSRTQLGALRAVAQETVEAGQVDRLKGWVGGVKANKQRIGAWEKTSLWSLVTALAGSPAGVWNLLGINEAAVPQAARRDLQAFAVGHLLGAMAKGGATTKGGGRGSDA